MEEKPDVVILHVGINDLLSRRESKTPEEQIADKIIEIGKKCKDHGIETIFILGIFFVKTLKITVNKMIKRSEKINDFEYIKNDKISISIRTRAEKSFLLETLLSYK